MRQISICIFVENLVDQKQGRGSKILLPSRRGIFVTIIGTICGKGVIDLTLRKPEAVGSKKRRRGDSKAEDVDVNATTGTRNDYFLEQCMEALNHHGMKGCCLAMDSRYHLIMDEVQNLT